MIEPAALVGQIARPDALRRVTRTTLPRASSQSADCGIKSSEVLRAQYLNPHGIVPTPVGTMSLRVLLIDFDVFSQVGGGQTFYRRVIERHPQAQFFYPSRGLDLRLRGNLPPNAEPFAIDFAIPDADVRSALIATGQPPTIIEHCELLCSIARPRQGDYFDIVEVPSFRPCAHLVRGLFAEHGIRVHIVSLGLLGWLSVSLRKAESSTSSDEVIRSLEAMEADSVAAADVRYTISELHADENKFRNLDVEIVAMIDALESFPVPLPEAPGDGPPDLWYVGRIDPAKGPDLFLEIAARVPRTAYRQLLMTGPDNTWVAKDERWSDDILRRARPLNLDVTYCGLLSDHELREQVYRGRSVIVVPSRTDSFNLVALEALANGCPVLLSRNTGAAGFLSATFPAIAPPIVDPEDVEDAAHQLSALLCEYPERSLTLRQTLRSAPLPRAREGFMTQFWTREPSNTATESASNVTAAIRSMSPLSRRSAARWRPFPSAHRAPELTVVVVASGPTVNVGPMMAALAQQTVQPAEILIVCEASSANAIEMAIAGSEMNIRIIMCGHRTFAEAANSGCQAARTRRILILLAVDLPAPDYLVSVCAALDAKQLAAATVVPRKLLRSLEGNIIPSGMDTDDREDAIVLQHGDLDAAGGFIGQRSAAAVQLPSDLHYMVIGLPTKRWLRPDETAVHQETGP